MIKNQHNMNLAPLLMRDSGNMKSSEKDAVGLLACQAMAKLTLDLVYRNDRIRSTGRMEEDFLFLPVMLDFSIIDFLLPPTKFRRFGDSLDRAYHSSDLGAFRKCVVRGDLHKFWGIGATTSAKICDIFCAAPSTSWTGLNQRYISLRASQLQNGLSKEMSLLGLLAGGLDDSGSDGLPYRYVMRYASLLRLLIDAADDVYSLFHTGKWLYPDIVQHYDRLLQACARSAAPNLLYTVNKEI